MRTLIAKHLEAVKARREQGRDGGFSLIELIIVVVILGILAAIAIPIFLNIQQQARQNAADTAAANGAAQFTAAVAQGQAPGAVSFTNFAPDYTVVAALGGSAPAGSVLGLDAFCITATAADGVTVGTSGPTC